MDNALLERLKTEAKRENRSLNKTEAKRENRSLNSLVEAILMDAMYCVPNAETLEAIEEARSGKYAGVLDASSFDAFMESVNAIE